MKATDIQPCVTCGKSPIGAGRITFHTVTLDRAVLDANAARSLAGLSMHFASNFALAEVMAPDPHVVKLMGDQDPSTRRTVHVCEDCAMHVSLWEIHVSLWEIIEASGKEGEA